MHDHHGSSADASAGLNLLPLWLQVLWAVVMGALVAQHLVVFGLRRGLDRVWSAAHALLAIGMLYMFLPWASAPLRPDVLVTAYCGLLFATLTVLAAHWIVTGSVERSGLLLTIDFAAMAYMSRMSDGGLSAVSYALVAFYCASAVVWTRSTPVPRAWRAGQVVMASAMAYMFIAMAPI